MTFIPPALHEAKRQAESALSTLMLAYPAETRAISLYFGLVETALKPAPMAITVHLADMQQSDATLYGFHKMLQKNTVLVFMDCPLVFPDEQRVTLALPNGTISGMVVGDDFDSASNYHILKLDNPYIYLDFENPDKDAIERGKIR